jgi:hypothetical protein
VVRSGLIAASGLLVVGALTAGGPLAPTSAVPLPRGGSGEATQQLAGGDFSISGRPSRVLRPGLSAPIDLRLENLRDQPRLVTRIHVALTIDAAHRAAGCSRARDFRVRQLRPSAYPLRIDPRRPRTLRSLGVRYLPRVRMVNLRDVNQDACKGAQLTFCYSGRSRRLRR